jgi:hypothetical protein
LSRWIGSSKNIIAEIDDDDDGALLRYRYHRCKTGGSVSVFNKSGFLGL